MNFTLDLKKKKRGQKDMDWIHMAQDKETVYSLGKKATNLPFPLNVGNFLASSENISLSRKVMLCIVSYAYLAIKCMKKYIFFFFFFFL
jgi:hypothetical protein